LNLDITRFGQAAPAGVRRFTISNVSLGGQNQTLQPVREFFAPAEFLEMSDNEKLSRPSFEAMTAGVNMATNEFAFTTEPTDWLEVEAIEYETWIVDDADKPPRASRPETPNQRYVLTKELLGKQARFGAAGNSELRRTGRAKYRTGRVAAEITKEGWSIVERAELKVQAVPGMEGAKATNYAEAAQALRKLQRTDPARAAGLKILRLSELS
jgi:hypothetical protein